MKNLFNACSDSSWDNNQLQENNGIPDDSIYSSYCIDIIILKYTVVTLNLKKKIVCLLYKLHRLFDYIKIAVWNSFVI